MKKLLTGLAVLCYAACISSLIGCTSVPKTVNSAKKEKARTVITTDGEVDDRDSFIRALLYSNDMDIAGIILTSSMYHYAGDSDKGIEPFRWTGTQWMYDFIDDYGKVYKNLKSHDKDYPSPSYLKSVTKIGNIKNKGEMEEVTEGSVFLEKLFLDNDPRTLYVQTWGGTNTTARALKSIEEKYSSTDKWESIRQKIYDKLIIYIILDQDESYSDYIAKAWPDLCIINDRSNFWQFAYAWQMHSEELNDTLKSSWCFDNLVDNKGPLMEDYALMGDGKYIEGEDYEEQRGIDNYLEKNPNYVKYDFISEGDSPSFLYLVDNGLRSMEDPSYGGWGGRFGKAGDKLYSNNVVDYDIYTKQNEAQYTLTRWITDMQNDFAGRIEWTLTSDDKVVNHAPSASVIQGLDITARAGENVTLTASAYDKDGDNLSYKWWRYFEADTYNDGASLGDAEEVKFGTMLFNVTQKVTSGEKSLNKISLTGADTKEVSFTVPSDAKSGDTIHIILEVKDDGKHTLKSYQRVIITVE